MELHASYDRIGRALQSADGDMPPRDGAEPVGQVQNPTEPPFVVRQGAGWAFMHYLFPVRRTFWLGRSWKPAP